MRFWLLMQEKNTSRFSFYKRVRGCFCCSRIGIVKAFLESIAALGLNKGTRIPVLGFILLHDKKWNDII